MGPSLLTIAGNEVKAVLAALYGGGRYGVKVRLPHAFIMTLLFGQGLSTRDKLKKILRLVKEHASNLAAFAAMYKTILGAMKMVTPGSPSRPPGFPEEDYHAFIAGAVGGYVVWGRYSSINYQILLYLSSRVLVALGKRLYQKFGRQPDPQLFRKLSSLVWGVVMVLFEKHPDLLHPSLRSSMDEIYRVT